MIATTYALSGVLLALTALLFVAGVLDAATQTLAWTRRVLLRIGGGELRLPDGERNVSRSRCARCRSRSSMRRAPAIGGIGAPWLFGVLVGTGEPRRDRMGLRARRVADAGRRGGRRLARCRRRTQAARGRCTPVVVHRLNAAEQRRIFAF